MALIKELKGIKPKIAENVYLAENCTIIGDVEIGEGSSIWFNVVLRGDVHYIKIGKDCNIQDNVVVHCTYQKYPTIIKDRVSIGHSAVVHACTIESDVLIGMGAIVMDNCHIHSNSLIAAGSVVVPGTIVEPNSVYAGIPARKVKDIDTKLLDSIHKTTEHYKYYTTWYNESPSNE